MMSPDDEYDEDEVVEGIIECAQSLSPEARLMIRKRLKGKQGGNRYTQRHRSERDLRDFKLWLEVLNANSKNRSKGIEKVAEKTGLSVETITGRLFRWERRQKSQS